MQIKVYKMCKTAKNEFIKYVYSILTLSLCDMSLYRHSIPSATPVLCLKYSKFVCWKVIILSFEMNPSENPRFTLTFGHASYQILRNLWHFPAMCSRNVNMCIYVICLLRFRRYQNPTVFRSVYFFHEFA